MSSQSEPEDVSSAAWTLPEELSLLAQLGDSDTVREVIAVFQSDTEIRIQKLRTAIAGADAVQARAEAHAIKGSAGQVGATHLSQICREIEAAALRKDLASAGGLLPDLENEFRTVRDIMSRTKIG
jgi:HPt (histidine-containing phosphotransfer) domain-containing protein